VTFTNQEKLKCIVRELALRRNVYRYRVSEHKMKQELADREIALMDAIRKDYEQLCPPLTGPSTAVPSSPTSGTSSTSLPRAPQIFIKS
jgi:hypothetical protein